MVEPFLSEILSFLGGFVTGGIAVKVAVDHSRRDNSRTKTIQKGNAVGGSQAGRDIKIDSGSDGQG